MSSNETIDFEKEEIEHRKPVSKMIKNYRLEEAPLEIIWNLREINRKMDKIVTILERKNI
jgi:hypothetical protein